MTRSDSESYCAPKADVVFVSRAILPSIASKNVAKNTAHPA
ncbi:MAG: hypothetical protein M5R36_16860 [Deltaproteobacteria bacterium]|nr:hypothetical protein [Deltaproteobacteria bacterium]